MTGKPKVQARGLTKAFGSDAGATVALSNVDLEIGDNEFVSLIGTSGCGKSTLLSIVAGLQEASAGDVLLDGVPIVGPGRDRGLVFQSYTLFPWLTARANVEFALRSEPGSKGERVELAREQLALVGLQDFEDAYPHQLSGGMKQRVAIARALSYRPQVLLMDEPFGALDALTRQMMQELLTKIWEEHKITVLFVTHDVEEAVFISDRVVVMTNRPGEIKEEITIDLPRPRSHELLATQGFGDLCGRVLESIRGEAVAISGWRNGGSH
ncbi:MAG TPA: ABC transporter ATP-binding protein [Solirubrobacterales bacterium]|nr:ABC transporter ATP-binding protein [Solirubrobacterales bacterium]